MGNSFIIAENGYTFLTFTGSVEALWTYTVRETGKAYAIGAPCFEIDGRQCVATCSTMSESQPALRLENGCSEYHYEGVLDTDSDLSLELILRIAEENPVVRWHYILRSKAMRALTKSSGQDALNYLAVSFAHLPAVTEVQLADFVEQVHSYCLVENEIAQRHFDNRLAVMGPLLYGEDGYNLLLLGYEHGSTIPDAFLHFQLSANRTVSLQAVKGNYLHLQPLDPEHAFTTLWLEMAAISGEKADLTMYYRTFVLKHMSNQNESRRPYIFYNTWNMQERSHWWHDKPYLAPLYEENVLREIDVAHRMGIEVFVLDTGWYQKTGDWRVNTVRFSDNLRIIKERLDGYAMKMGLWFGPTSAALTSEAFRRLEHCRMSRHGEIAAAYPIWETEDSAPMCLVSEFSDLFANELIRLAHEVGVRYFKWDAIGQYGCDDPQHWHGTGSNSEQERANSYAFQLGQQMTRIVERVCEAIPDAIVDFDITEAGRSVGLGFLAAGKYFLINNGPYNQSYDLPLVFGQQNDNLFFYPGQARGWIVRTPLSYDEWLPSSLFLVHNFPDDPASSQLVNLAATVLGYNGIWGELTSVSEAGVALIQSILAHYKIVREDMTASAAVRTGCVSGSPEIYEKILPATGRGAVICFATRKGSYTYVTRSHVEPINWHVGGDVIISYDEQGRARIEMFFAEGGAQIIFFGVGSISEG